MDYTKLPASLMPWENAFKEQVEQLIRVVSRYLTHEDVVRIKKACLFAAHAHQYQSRSSGEPYIFHPIAVALILTEVQLDTASIIGAILHDVIEDTEINYADIALEFNEEVAQIVEGVSKLTQIKFGSKEEAKAENFRKMILAMTKNIRVIMVKLADRLHNMRTLGALAPYKKRRIAKDTLEIYAPIASRLGMYVLQVQLENLCFQNLYPWRYEVIKKMLVNAQKSQSKNLNLVKEKLQKRLTDHGINARLSTREKHLWSIYKKIREKGSIENVTDIFATRVLVNSVDECYRVLGIAHGLFKPVLGKFKDYIALPKANGYQSLHTLIFSQQHQPIELQIRTRDMHIIAEVGAAAHWRYKDQYDGLVHNRNSTSQWMKSVLDTQEDSHNSEEFMETIKQDFLQDAIYVFTPKGKIVELPRGATPIDFAYCIHSDIGNACVSAKINHTLVPLKTLLKNGQTIEITTAHGAKPNPAWLNFVKTAKARAAIRHYLNHIQYDEAVIIGKRLLDQATTKKNIKLDDKHYATFAALAKQLSFVNTQDLYAEIGFGKRPAVLVLNRMYNLEVALDAANLTLSLDTIFIKSVQDIEVGFGRCCRPLPGDDIIGFFSVDKGLIIHRDSCRHLSTFRKNPERFMDVAWDKKVSGDFPVDIKLIVQDRRGSWASIVACMTTLDVNMETIETKPIDSNIGQINLTVRVKNRTHLAIIFKELKKINIVKKVTRNK